MSGAPRERLNRFNMPMTTCLSISVGIRRRRARCCWCGKIASFGARFKLPSSLSTMSTWISCNLSVTSATTETVAASRNSTKKCTREFIVVTLKLTLHDDVLDRWGCRIFDHRLRDKSMCRSTAGLIICFTGNTEQRDTHLYWSAYRVLSSDKYTCNLLCVA